MYGNPALPNTGLAAAGGAAALNGFWIAMILITAAAVLLAVGRLIPRREV